MCVFFRLKFNSLIFDQLLILIIVSIRLFARESQIYYHFYYLEFFQFEIWKSNKKHQIFVDLLQYLCML